MKTRVVLLRAASVAACLLTLGAACSSSSHGASSTTTTSPGPSTTADALHTPNSIPFVVGAKVGLPNGWLVRVAKVHRPYTNPKLPAPPSGREYVALDMQMENDGGTTETVKAADLIQLGDSDGKVDPVVPVPGRANGIDGSYPTKQFRQGQLVFAVPKRAQLRMAFNGPLINTQQTIWTIDPPTVGLSS
jgi:hypothetical protein